MSDSTGALSQYLDIRGIDGVGRRHELLGNSLVIGRSADSQIILESTTVSRHHARLLREDSGRWRIVDMGSRNGTSVNGHAIKEQVLSPGDLVQIGNFQLTLIAPLPARTPTHAAMIAPFNTTVHVSDDAGRLSTLRDMEPPRVAATHLTTLNELAQKLLQTADPRQRSAELCRLMVSPHFHADWAMLLRAPLNSSDQPPEMLSDPQHGPAVTALEQPHVSRSLLRAVAQQGEAVLASNAQSAAIPANIEMSIAASVQAMAAIACPLRRSESGVELLYVTLPPQYGTGEWLALISLAAKQYQQVEEAWEARARELSHAALERELEGAREIQMRLVPKPGALARFKNNGLDVAIGFAPSRFVGGDYVDTLTMKDGRVFLALADVCGHGLAAALVTSAVHTLIHASIRAGSDLQSLADGLNQHLCETLRGDSFVTFVGLAIDPASGAIECINAGHPPLLLATATGVRAMTSGLNLPLGLDSSAMEPQAEKLDAGELLMIYSDGLCEQADSAGKMLGIKGLTAKLHEICAKQCASADHIADELGEFLTQRQGGRPPEDDQSYLFARRL